MHLIARIAALWRYPVKSMGGERCDAIDLTATGIAGDRQLAFESADAPKGRPLLRAAQRAAMLRFHARTGPSGRILIHTPRGAILDTDDPAVVDVLLGELASLGVPLPAVAPGHLPHPPPLRLVRSPRPLTDVRPVALHSLQTARRLAHGLDATRLAGLGTGFDDRRLRGNIVLDLLPGFAEALASTSPPTASAPASAPADEDGLAGRTLQVGETARLRILERIPRCRIVSLAPDTAEHDPHLLRFLARDHHGRAGIYARTVTPGTLRLGDPIVLL